MNENWKDYYEKEAEYLRFIPSEDLLEKHRVQLALGLFSAAKKTSSVLDVGCGDGYLCSVFQKKGINKISGVDFSSKRIEFARKTFPGISFLEGSVYSLPIEDKSFDLVTAVEILEHLEKPEDAVIELKRVSRRYIIATVPDGQVLQQTVCPHCLKTFKLGGHLNSFNENSLRKLFVQANLNIIKLKKYTFTSFLDRVPFRWLPEFFKEFLKDFSFRTKIIKQGNYMGILAKKP